MSTKREAILSQLITQLAGTTGVGTRIYRSRVTPVSRSEGHVLIVEPVSDSCEVGANKFQWTLNVRLSVILLHCFSGHALRFCCSYRFLQVNLSTYDRSLHRNRLKYRAILFTS